VDVSDLRRLEDLRREKDDARDQREDLPERERGTTHLVHHRNENRVLRSKLNHERAQRVHGRLRELHRPRNRRRRRSDNPRQRMDDLTRMLREVDVFREVSNRLDALLSDLRSHVRSIEQLDDRR